MLFSLSLLFLFTLSLSHHTFLFLSFCSDLCPLPFLVLYVFFTELEYFVNEDDGMVTVCLELSGVLAPTATDIWIHLITSEYTASGNNVALSLSPPSPLIVIILHFLAGYDYVELDTILSFPAGSVDGAKISADVTILDDELLEGYEHFNIHIYNVEQNIIVLEPQYVSITIYDDEG